MRKYADPRNCHPNACFSLARPGDANYDAWKEQRRTRGFDDTELWNLDSTIIKFILPRLKEFTAKTVGYPGELGSFEEWIEILNKIIDGFETYLKDPYFEDIKDPAVLKEEVERREDKVQEAFGLFSKYFSSLWW